MRFSFHNFFFVIFYFLCSHSASFLYFSFVATDYYRRKRRRRRTKNNHDRLFWIGQSPPTTSTHFNTHGTHLLLCVNTDIVIRRNNFCCCSDRFVDVGRMTTEATEMYSYARFTRGNAYNNMRRKQNIISICQPKIWMHEMKNVYELTNTNANHRGRAATGHHTIR